MAIQGGIGNLGGIIASNIFQTRDQPRFILACELRSPPVEYERAFQWTFGRCAVAIEIGFLCMGLIVTVFSAYAYHRANTVRMASAKRDGINESKYTVGFYVI